LNDDRSERSLLKFEKAISYLLISGVIVSLVLEVIGMAHFYHTYGRLAFSESKAVFIHGTSYFTFFLDLFHAGPTGGKGIYLMTLGIAVLILTPYLRVVMSVVYFAWDRNIKYVLITLFVLILLTLSLTIA
jgi:uncharacterized membrane protein